MLQVVPKEIEDNGYAIFFLFLFFCGGGGGGGGKQGDSSMKHGHEHFEKRNSIFMLESSIGNGNLSQTFRSPRALHLLKITSASGKKMSWQRTPFQMTREVK